MNRELLIAADTIIPRYYYYTVIERLIPIIKINKWLNSIYNIIVLYYYLSNDICY